MNESTYHIADILREKADQYQLTIFHPDAVAWLEGQLFEKRGHPYLKCLASGAERRAYPEEIVRQLYVKKLMGEYGYPRERIQVERPVFFGSGIISHAVCATVPALVVYCPTLSDSRVRFAKQCERLL